MACNMAGIDDKKGFYIKCTEYLKVEERGGGGNSSEKVLLVAGNGDTCVRCQEAHCSHKGTNLGLGVTYRVHCPGRNGRPSSWLF